jgi:hypothetical protein
VPGAVHCHVPITVRAYGIPDDEAVRALATAVRRQVRARLALAERLLAGAAASPAAPAAGQWTTARPAETYDEQRDGPDGYAVPSYYDRGRPVAVPVHRAMRPGRTWRVLRALTITLQVGVFLDYVEDVLGGDPAHGAALPQRILYADIESERRTVTVWLVETEVTTTLGDLLRLVSARATELMNLPPERELAHAGSPFEEHRKRLAMLDRSGQLSRLPSLRTRNARRLHGTGVAAELLHGSWTLWAAMQLPKVEPSTLLDIGSVIRSSPTLAEVSFCVDPAEFESRYELSWDCYLTEAGQRQVRLDLLPTRVRGDSLVSAVGLLALTAYQESGASPPDRPDVVPARKLIDADPPAAPELVSRAGLDFARGLAPLRPLPALDNPAQGDRMAPGTIAVLAVAYLPVDAEILGAARLRPLGRRQANAARALLAQDVSDRQWKYACYLWLGRFGTSLETTRPAGGTAFEYVLADLAATNDLVRLFDAVDGAGWDSLELRLVQHCAPTRYAAHPRVVALLRRLQAATLANRQNTYLETAAGRDPGGVELDRQASRRVTPGVPGHSVLGDIDSIYFFERETTAMKPAAAARLRTAVESARRQLLGDIADGRISRTLSAEDFLREAVARGSAAAQITNADFEKRRVQRSLRVLEVHRRDIGLMPSWDVVVQLVDRVTGTREWTAVGQPFSRTADEFEADLIYWRLGRAGEIYQAVTIGITVIGGIAIAWEAGIVATLVEAAGGTTTVLTSIALSELIYLGRLIFSDAEFSVEGFLMAAVDGYLGALGFRAGALAAAPIGRAIGTATLRRVWTGVVLEKITTGAVGGGIGGTLELFAHDVVEVIVRDGDYHTAADYARRIGLGAALGVLGEFTLAPVLHRLGGRGQTALRSAADLVQQLRREGFSLAEFASSAAEALANLRGALRSVVVEDAVREYLAAFRTRVEEMLTAWGPTVVARRVLELSEAPLSEPAVRGLRRFLAAADEPGLQDAAHRLATTFARYPQQTVHLLEVLSELNEDVARRLMTGTFGTSAELAAFIGRLGRYGADQQRAALRLLGRLIDEFGLVARPALPGQSAEQVRDAQLAAALRAESRAMRIQAERLRREAQQQLENALVADTYSRRRADRLLEQAAATEREAADRERVSAELAAGVDTRRSGQRVQSLAGARRPDMPDPDFDAEIDEVFRQLEAGAGTARQPWIRLRAHRNLGIEETDALVRTVFTSRSGNPIVFRVQGGTGIRSREYVSIGAGGRVRINTGGRDLNLNVGSLERAIEFIVERRVGARLMVFEVEEGWLRSLRGIATPEQGLPASVETRTGLRRQLPPAGSLSDVGGLARTVDTRQAADQLQIDGALVRELQEFIVAGSGRVLEFLPGPARRGR